MAVDLHLHSLVSDGVDSPTQLMEMAANVGLTHVALTDHDTLDGISEARQAAQEHGIEIIAGTELSVDHDGTKIHMLVYFLEPGAGPLQTRLSNLRTGRDDRNVLIVERLVELGYAITLEDVRRHAKGPSVGRPHIADALVEKGYVATRDDAFTDLLRDGGQAYVERTRLTAIEAIVLAREGGAVPVIAHPITMGLTRDRYAEVFDELVKAGLGGIETYHPMHDSDLVERLTSITASLGIAATGGSDFHGITKRAYRIGQVHNGGSIPFSAVEQLIAERG